MSLKERLVRGVLKVISGFICEPYSKGLADDLFSRKDSLGKKEEILKELLEIRHRG